jgi:hypothetical protein
MSNYEELHLDTGERVIIEVRKHWIVFIGRVIFFVLSVFSLPVLYYLSYVFLPVVADFIYANINLFSFLYSIWVLMFWLGLFVQWTKYFLDVWYVTETRIIDVEQKTIFHREVSNLRFDKIQDISVEVDGILATFLNYGNITVQTASENQDFFISFVKNPEEVKRVIFNRHNEVGDKI